MQKTSFTIFFFICFVSMLFAQGLNINKIGNLSYTNRLNDVWGYVDPSGHEYALVGVENGVSIVDVGTDPANPVELFFIPGPVSTWRDLKVWKQYAYVTNETGGGLLVIDLTNLPNSIRDTAYTFGGNVLTAHNLFIDENGITYIMGMNSHNGGIYMLDVDSDPWKPQHAGTYATRYVHDGYARNDTFWAAEINDGTISVIDVSDKSNPVVLATFNTPGNFAHNCWLSDNGKYLVTTDEISGGYVAVFDVSDLTNVHLLDKWQSNPGSGVIPHNAFIVGNHIVTSYYNDGVTITDMSRPNNLIQVGYYDTSPFTGSGFTGCWGVYPYLPSGNILASDGEQGLFILQSNYPLACYLEGTITDSTTSLPVPGVTVTIENTGQSDTSGIGGDYATGTATAGTYDVTFRKLGYIPRTIQGVTLTAGVLTHLDVKLMPEPPFGFNIQVRDAGTGQAIPDAMVRIVNPYVDVTATSNQFGEASVYPFYSGTYTVIAGKWGYRIRGIGNFEISGAGSVTIQLHRGYYDDFTFDFGWTATGSPGNGNWVREKPVGTQFSDSLITLLFNPDQDIDSDYGDECYMTGNNGFLDFVNSGTKYLISPYFHIADYQQPWLSYYRWVSNINQGGFTGDDTLFVWLTTPTDTVLLEQAIQSNIFSQGWKFREFYLPDYTQPADSMKIIFMAQADFDPGELLEAAVDLFQVIDSANVPWSTISHKSLTGQMPELFPNPASETVMIALPPSMDGGGLSIAIADLSGKTYLQKRLEPANTSHTFTLETRGLPTGIYLVQIEGVDFLAVKKLVIIQD